MRTPAASGSPRWKRLRLKVLERDGWRCVKCAKPGKLECHHVKPVDQGGEMWAMDNLETLCRTCHIEHHRDDYKRPRFIKGWADLVEEPVNDSDGS